MTNATVTRDTRIGLIGLGIMGAPVARHLRECGYPLTVWNLEPEYFERVEKSGAEWADSPAEVFAACDIVLVCVLGDDALRSVCLGDNGFASAGKGAGLVIDLSTTSPQATLEIAVALKDKTGADWLDAPMSGGPQPAGEGKLTLMIGGSEALCSSARPLLDDIGSTITRIGELGDGQKAKILNQAIVGVNYILMAELLAVCRAADIDADLIRNALKGGLADSSILQRIFPQMYQEDFDPPRSYARQVNKDLKSVKTFVKQLGLELPLLDVSIERYAEYTDAGNEMMDSASVSRLYQDRGK
jgi:3-hydroxyisobutyrate dehydrogenase